MSGRSWQVLLSGEGSLGMFGVPCTSIQLIVIVALVLKLISKALQLAMEEVNQEQKFMFLAYDQLANTEILPQIQQQPSKNYIKFQYPLGYRQRRSPLNQQPYQDPCFTIDLQRVKEIDPERQIVVKRISHIYQKGLSPALFPLNHNQKPKPIKSHQKIYPHFIYELVHFEVFSFQKQFITQQLNSQGRYELIVNHEGKFQLQVVDDCIPVYKDDDSSIWQLDVQQPWQLVVAKVWAKRLGGYHQIQHSKPFEFIEYFTPSSWKYLNLHRQGSDFLSNYHDKVGRTCRVLLKTKAEAEVQRCGLISAQIAYQLVQFIQYQEKKKRQFYLLIKSTSYHAWAGSLSIFDSQFRPVFQKLKQTFKLETNFLMNQSDFFNIFSSAYLTSCNRTFPEYINFVGLKTGGRPLCLAFRLKESGFFMFNLVQSKQNLRSLEVSQLQYASRLSFLMQNNYNQGQQYERYLKIKFLLSKEAQSSSFNLSSQHNIAPNSIRSTKLSQMNVLQNYHLCDFQYQKGYNQGDAHPLMLQAGNYVLQIYPQNVGKCAYLTFQCVSHQPVQLRTLAMDQNGTLSLLKESLKSIIHKVPCQPLENEGNGFVSFGNQFNNIGFGFVAVIFYKRPIGRLSILIDLEKLRKEGYFLVDQRDQKQKLASIVLLGGQFHIFVLSRQQDGRKADQYVWPPTSFKYVLLSK